MTNDASTPFPILSIETNKQTNKQTYKINIPNRLVSLRLATKKRGQILHNLIVLENYTSNQTSYAMSDGGNGIKDSQVGNHKNEGIYVEKRGLRNENGNISLIVIDLVQSLTWLSANTLISSFKSISVSTRLVLVALCLTSVSRAFTSSQSFWRKRVWRGIEVMTDIQCSTYERSTDMALVKIYPLESRIIRSSRLGL